MHRIHRLAPLVAPLVSSTACTTAAEAVPCSLDFSASVNAGPSKGTELAGTLRLSVAADGAISGELTQEDESTVTVVGSADNYAINLVFTLAEDQLIYGVGTADQPVVECAGTFGGPFTGPAEGDSGDWIARAFGADASTRSYNDD